MKIICSRKIHIRNISTCHANRQHKKQGNTSLRRILFYAVEAKLLNLFEAEGRAGIFVPPVKPNVCDPFFVLIDGMWNVESGRVLKPRDISNCIDAIL